MIDGLKVTLTGEALRKLLETRAAQRRAAAAHWQSECEHAAEAETVEASVLPEHMCANEADRHAWHAEVLTFLRDHLDASEIYRLDISDLEYAELLPRKPERLEQDDFEESARVGLGSGWIARRVCNSPEIIEIVNTDAPGS